MALEEFKHFFQESQIINTSKDLDFIKNNFDDVKKYCESESLGNAFNAFSINLYKYGETAKNKNIHHSMANIIIAMRDAKDYNTYINIRKKFEQIFLSIYPDISHQIFAIKTLNDNITAITFLDKEGKSISFNKSDRLFHTSDVIGLTELKPVFKSERDGLLYPFNRIYFCKNFPIQPSGSFWNKTGAVYEYIPATTSVKLFRDEEFYNRKGACFLKTDTPLPVKDVTDEIVRNYAVLNERYKNAR